MEGLQCHLSARLTDGLRANGANSLARLNDCLLILLEDEFHKLVELRLGYVREITERLHHESVPGTPLDLQLLRCELV